MITKRSLMFCLVVTCILFSMTVVLMYATDTPNTLVFNILCFLLPATVFSAFMLALASLSFASREIGRVYENEAKKDFEELSAFASLPKELQTKDNFEKILTKL